MTPTGCAGPTPWSCPGSERRRRPWNGSSGPVWSSRSGPGSPPTVRSSASASACSSCSRAATRTARRPSACCRVGRSGCEDAPTLPHIGWNQVVRKREHAAFDGIADGADLYFVHSYAGLPSGGLVDDVVLATTEHGRPFVSAVARGNLVGVQFHPERSGTDGLRLLANVVAAAAVAARIPA